MSAAVDASFTLNAIDGGGVWYTSFHHFASETTPGKHAVVT